MGLSIIVQRSSPDDTWVDVKTVEGIDAALDVCDEIGQWILANNFVTPNPSVRCQFVDAVDGSIIWSESEIASFNPD